MYRPSSVGIGPERSSVVYTATGFERVRCMSTVPAFWFVQTGEEVVAKADTFSGQGLVFEGNTVGVQVLWTNDSSEPVTFEGGSQLGNVWIEVQNAAGNVVLRATATGQLTRKVTVPPGYKLTVSTTSTRRYLIYQVSNAPSQTEFDLWPGARVTAFSTVKGSALVTPVVIATKEA